MENTEYNLLELHDRKKLVLTGVTSIDGFGDNFINLTLTNDKLNVVGEKIKITAFSKSSGNFTAEGVFTSLKYNVKKAPFFKRLFK